MGADELVGAAEDIELERVLSATEADETKVVLGAVVAGSALDEDTAESEMLK